MEISDGEHSRKRRLRNGLPQGSVLAPILFNIYTADFLFTVSSQYVYADDSALGSANDSFEKIQASLKADLDILARYFQHCHLKLSKQKTVCTIFHLANKLATRELTIMLNGQRLKCDANSTYFGKKKLVGTQWGMNFKTLRTSALALVYSTA